MSPPNENTRQNPQNVKELEKAIVSLNGIVKLSTIEQELAASYSHSLRAKKVIFDLRKVSWIGYLPGALLFNWAALLRRKHRREVEILTAPYDELSDQARGMLLGQGILQLIHESGALVATYPPVHRRGQPLTGLTSANDLWETLQETAERIISYQKLGARTDRILRDAFQTILYELAENALIHTGGTFPHYGVSIARSGVPMKRSSGFMSTFEAGTDYIEVYVGDLGRGLQASLEPSMPTNYVHPFVSDHHFLKPEMPLVYALEFSTTSDKEGRLRRLRKLLDNPKVDPDQIATGLYCVTELARSLAGQFVLRTPKAILTFKFFPDRYEPEIRGRKELGIKDLAPLPGTHYLVRLPLTIPSKRATTSVETALRASLAVRTLDAFGGLSGSESVESILHYAISTVDEYLMKNRQASQILLILPPEFALQSRVEALFIAAIGSMNHGRCLLMWANKHASFTIRTRESTSPKAIRNAGQSVLIGDLLANSFRTFGNVDPRWRSLLVQNGMGTEDVQLKEKFISNVRFAARKALDQKLKGILARSDIKHSGESFLLEGQYYTETFYEIDRAWDDPENARLFAEWALSKLTQSVDVLIAHAPPIFPMVQALADLMKEYWGADPIVITHELDESPATTISQLISLSGHHAVIVTDVICTAERLNNLLDLVAGIELDGILALVDGRLDESQKPIPWLSASEGRFLQIHSVLSEPIDVYADPPKRGRRTQQIGELVDEQVYVIDRGTRAPTLYVRPAKPQLQFGSLLRESAKTSNSLLNGHAEFRNRHYLYFLNFPRLFEFLQQPIMAWIQQQISFVEQGPRSKEEQWHAFVYNPDESLSWLIESLPELSQKPSVRVLTYEHLRAPLPPREGEAIGNWIIVLPALASGTTARLALEYVSRHNPSTILLLCIASRMDPYDLTFYASVNQYRGADLHTACFIEFPVPAFEIGRGTCPQCTELAKLIELREMIESYQRDSTDLMEALNRKITASRAVPLGSSTQDDWLARQPSDEDSERAYLRGLYELAPLKIETRRELNALLTGNTRSIDRFLQVLSAERFNNQFSRDVLNSVLYKADVAVRTRLLDIILKEKPPFPIGRFMGAIVHLLPHIFVPNAVAMIKRYSTSPRDVEEICIALLQVGIEPSDAGELLALSRSEPAFASPLFSQTLDILKLTRAKDRLDFDQSIEAIVQVWAQLARSSQFSEAIDSLAQTSLAEYKSWEEIQALVTQISREWKDRIIELISIIEFGPLWRQLKRRSVQIPIAVTRLETSIAKLELISRTERQQTLFPNDRFARGIQATAREIDHACKELARELYSFLVNPVMCSAAELGEILVTIDGSELKVIKEIDQRVPKVFCHPEDLKSICGQLIGNWKKHKQKGTKGTTVSFRIYESDSDVILEFSDDIEGEFDLQSRGGLAFVSECCRAYGGTITTKAKENRKSIMIHMRPVNSR